MTCSAMDSATSTMFSGPWGVVREGRVGQAARRLAWERLAARRLAWERLAARRLAWERLARSLHSCVSSSHRSSSFGPNRSRGSIFSTTR